MRVCEFLCNFAPDFEKNIQHNIVMKKLILFLFGALCATSLLAQQTNIPYTATARVVPAHSEPLDALEYGGATYNDAASTYDAATQQGTLVFDGTVTKIKDHAFYQNNTLLSMALPNGLTEIGESAFSQCKSLQTINIPEGVTNIMGGAFFECEALDGVILPQSLETLEWAAFRRCKSLRSIIIPDKITKISRILFEECYALANIVIPSTVVEIEDSAFWGTAITSFTVPEGVTAIPGWCFWGCHNLQSVSLPDGVTTIGKLAFAQCFALTSVTLPAGLTRMVEGAFSKCSSLTSYVIPEGMTTLPERLCGDDSALVSVHIPSTVTRIQTHAFENCISLREIIVDAVTPPSLDSEVFLKVPFDALIVVPTGSLAAYKAAWPGFTNIREHLNLTINSSDETKGKAYGPGAAYNLEHVTAYAIPEAGYKFANWSDGNTANPRTITITQDTVLTANFEDDLPKPTEPGVRLKVTTKDDKVYEFDTKNIENTEFYRVEE